MREKKEMFRSVWIPVATALVACMLPAAPAMSAWVRFGSIDTNEYLTCDAATNQQVISPLVPHFADMSGTMPAELFVSGGVPKSAFFRPSLKLKTVIGQFDRMSHALTSASVSGAA